MALTPKERNLDLPDDFSSEHCIIPQNISDQGDTKETSTFRAPLTPISNRASPVLLSFTVETDTLLAKYHQRNDTASRLPLPEPHRPYEDCSSLSIITQDDDRCDVDCIVCSTDTGRIKCSLKEIQTILNLQQRQMDIIEHDHYKGPIHITPLTLNQAIDERNATHSYMRHIKVPPRLQPQPTEQLSRLPFHDSTVYPVFQALGEAAGYEPSHPDWPKYLRDLAFLPPPPVDLDTERQLIERDVDTFGDRVQISRINCSAPKYNCIRYRFPDERGISRACCSFLLAARGPRKALTLPHTLLRERMTAGDSDLFAEKVTTGGSMRVAKMSAGEILAHDRALVMMREAARFGDHPKGSFWQSR